MTTQQNQKQSPHFQLLVEVDSFLAGFLLFSITGLSSADDDETSLLEAVSISLQLMAFSLYAGAIFSAIVGVNSGKIRIGILMSVVATLTLFTAVFVAAYVQLVDAPKVEQAPAFWCGFGISVGAEFGIPSTMMIYNLLIEQGSTENGDNGQQSDPEPSKGP